LLTFATAVVGNGISVVDVAAVSGARLEWVHDIFLCVCVAVCFTSKPNGCGISQK